jgi:hypothetical protein
LFERHRRERDDNIEEGGKNRKQGEERMKNKEILRVKRNREKERERTREGSGRKTERKSKV